MEVKQPTTIEEQITILEKRGCIVGNRDFTRKILNEINYYRLTAYFLPFKKSNNEYVSNLPFEKVYNIYEFDRKLRGILFQVIEKIETMLRFQLAYHHAHKYGSLGYLDKSNFNVKHKHDSFNKKIKKMISVNKNQKFVKHHIDNYDSQFPIWVIIELFSMRDISTFYLDLYVRDQMVIANDIFHTTYECLSSWLHCFTLLRNYCAHYSRLYFNIFTAVPKTPDNFAYKLSNRIFDYILMLKFLYNNIGNWTIDLVTPLEALIDTYSAYIDFAHINFPDNWLELLE